MSFRRSAAAFSWLFVAACYPDQPATPFDSAGETEFSLKHDFKCDDHVDCQNAFGAFSGLPPDGMGAGGSMNWGLCVDSICRVTCVTGGSLDAGSGYVAEGASEPVACPPAGRFCVHGVETEDIQPGVAVEPSELACLDGPRAFECTAPTELPGETEGIDRPVCMPGEAQ